MRGRDVSARWAAVLVVVLIGRAVAAPVNDAGTANASSSQDVSSQAAAILDDYDSAHGRFMEAWQKAATNDERQKIAQTSTPEPKTYARRALDLARAHLADPGAVDAVEAALRLICQNMDHESVRLEIEGIDLLAAHHLNTKNLPAVFQWLTIRPSVRGEAFLRAVIEKSDNRANRGRALLALADYFRQQSKFGHRLQQLPGFRDEIAKQYDRDVFDALPDNAEKPLAQAKSLYQKVADEYADVRGPQSSIADQAKNVLWALDHLGVGNKAPQIEGETLDGTPMKLSDYRGKVVVLDFWGDW